MLVPRYWAKKTATVSGTDGREYEAIGWGWSTTSQAEAEQRAAERLERNTQRLTAGEKELPRGYGYASYPMREEMLKEFPSADGAPFAIVTRNAYGCLVLNTAKIMFVDVDVPGTTNGEAFVGFFKGLFGKRGPDPRGQREGGLLALLECAVSADPTLGLRSYRTAEGLRYLVTSKLADPESDDAHSEMGALSADPSYLKLCKVQKSFRARLSPKPWRISMQRPPCRWPFADAKQEQAFEKWQKEYVEACRGQAVCQFLKEYGPSAQSPEIAAVVEFHDKMTGAQSGLPLA